MFSLTLATTTLILAHTATQPVPTAEQVLDRFVEITGGKEAHLKIRNRRERAKTTASHGGGGVEIFEKAHPNLRRKQIHSEFGGKRTSGVFDGVPWTLSRDGPHISTGTIAELLVLFSHIDMDVNWRNYFAKVENSGPREFDGVPCYAIVYTLPSGYHITQYYEVDSGLRRGVHSELKTPDGRMSGTRVYSDYRKIDDIMMPYKVVATQHNLDSGEKWSLTSVTTELTHNVQFPPNHFVPPAEVTALIKAQKDSSADKP
jgi:hypothetical protein